MRINEDFLDAVDACEITPDVNLTRDELFSDKYEITTGILFEEHFKTEIIQTILNQLKRILNIFLPDNAYTEPIVFDTGHTHKEFPNIDNFPDVKQHESKITLGDPYVIIAFSMNVPKTMTPPTLFRFIFSYFNLVKNNKDLMDFTVRNSKADLFKEYNIYSDSIDADNVRELFKFRYNDFVLDENSSFNNVHKISRIAFQTYGLYRDIFLPKEPYAALLKTIPEFKPQLAILQQMKEMAKRVAGSDPLVTKRVNELSERYITIGKDFLSDDYKFAFSGSLTDLNASSGSVTFEMKKFRTKFSTNFFMDFMKPVYDGRPFKSYDAYTIDVYNYSNFKHSLFIYLGAIIDDRIAWPYYGGLFFIFKKEKERSEFINELLSE